MDRPRFNVDITLRDDNGDEAACVPNGGTAIQCISVENLNLRPYRFRAIATPTERTLSYPELTPPTAAQVTGTVLPSETSVGQDRVRFNDSQRSTAHDVEVSMTLDVRASDAGAWTSIPTPMQSVSCGG